MRQIETAIVGGGHAGQTMSYFSVDLRAMAARGIVLLGHLQGINDGDLIFADDLAQSLARGDESLKKFKRAVDDYVIKNGLEFPAEPEPGVEVNIPSSLSRLNLKTQA